MEMNKRYKDLKVTPGTYVPPVKTDFPEEDPYVDDFQDRLLIRH